MPKAYIARVKNYRWEHRVTQVELARAVEISRQALINIETGRSDPSLSTAIKLAKYFGTSVERLFTSR